MDIGKPVRTIIIEPLEEPAPSRPAREPVHEPAAPERETAPERVEEPVPA